MLLIPYIPSLNKTPEGKTKPPLRVNSRADAIRSKNTFYMIDHLHGLGKAVPRYNIQDFLDPKKRRKMMFMGDQQLVRFNVRPTRNIMVTQEKRWRNRIKVRCSRWPPLQMWSSSILNSHIFKSFIIFLIFLNMIVLIVSTEIKERTGPDMERTKVALEVIIWVIILIFIAEIALHWFVSFQMYWKNPWNVFDFTVTFLSFIPGLFFMFGSIHNAITVQLFLVCRVLRCLKLFSRVEQVRVLFMAFAKTLKAMALILVLLVFLFYVFSVSGIFFFESYSRSHRNDLTYNMYFMDMPNALVTIFILLTMDHWYALLQDLWKVPEINKVISGIFVCLWLLIGAMIFRNLLVALMVTNLQNIRRNQRKEEKQIETQKQADKFKMELLEKRYSQNPTGTSMDKFSIDTHPDYPDYSHDVPHPGHLDWETYIHKNLPALCATDEGEQVLWPRDSLFTYFELLEKLQYNLEERKELQQYAVLALSNLEDK